MVLQDMLIWLFNTCSDFVVCFVAQEKEAIVLSPPVDPRSEIAKFWAYAILHPSRIVRTADARSLKESSPQSIAGCREGCWCLARLPQSICHLADRRDNADVLSRLHLCKDR